MIFRIKTVTKCVFLLTVAVILVNSSVLTKKEELIRTEGDLYVAVILDGCRNSRNDSRIPHRTQSLVSASLSVTERVNFVGMLGAMRLGVSVRESCDLFETIFDLYELGKEYYLIGAMSESKLGSEFVKFGDLLGVPTVKVGGGFFVDGDLVVGAAVEVVEAMGWGGGVEVVGTGDGVVGEFFGGVKEKGFCVKECFIYEKTCLKVYNNSNPMVFFGSTPQIENYVKLNKLDELDEDVDVLFVPLDGGVPKGLPQGSFVIIPPHNPPTPTYKTTETFTPSPLFLYAAKTILTYVINVQRFIDEHCNDTVYKINCIRNKYNQKKYKKINIDILETLKMKELEAYFVYDVYRVDNNSDVTKNNFLEPMVKVFAYNVFSKNLTVVDSSVISTLIEAETNATTVKDDNSKCVNYFTVNNFFIDVTNLSFRSEAWVYAFLTLSLLGVTICMSILVFILVSICRRDILEGNPTLTISLLVGVTLLFCSVLPFSLEENSTTKYTLCITKSLCITLVYAIIFSLLLSRCILLATASKEIGFMSHIAGPVQAFLCLFIFGVQAALSLQLINNKCGEIYRSNSFVYLLSYNIMLLLLLLCLCPLIYKCDRNYREGKYFCVAIVMASVVWSVWLPLFVVVDARWKEVTLCSGLVGTAGVFLGAVFVPRTYLMTIAAAKNKITSCLPSINTANSIVDIYRTNSQPVYDCVNVAAINAVNVARAGVTISASQPDFYSSPTLPEEEDLDFRCDTPTNDKITRF